MYFKDMSEIRKLNKEKGYHFFDRATMSFFNSRVESRLLNEHFITSERQNSEDKKRYTIRKALENGSIETIGDFMGFETIKEAKLFLNKLNNDRKLFYSNLLLMSFYY
jgi:hypothetical protein